MFYFVCFTYAFLNSVILWAIGICEFLPINLSNAKIMQETYRYFFQRLLKLVLV